MPRTDETARAEYAREWNIANKDRIAERKKQFYIANREVFAERDRQHYKANREHVIKNTRKYREANRERLAECARKWRAANNEKQVESRKKWEKSNPDKVRAKLARRRATKLNATPAWVDHEKIAKIYAEAVRRKLQVDHIVPLNHPCVCGLHVPWNLQLLAESENNRKNNHFDI